MKPDGVGGVQTAETERNKATFMLTSMPWLRSGAFWVATVFSAGEMLAGGLWFLLPIEYVRSLFTHLHLPFYLLTILGIWRLLYGVALLLPRFPRLKEWAYAGGFFGYSGLVACQVLVGDGPDAWAKPAVFGLIALISWALRPPEWRMASREVSPAATAKAWAMSIVAIIVLLVLGYLSVPFAPPPYPLEH
jgi:hypothetical protein